MADAVMNIPAVYWDNERDKKSDVTSIRANPHRRQRRQPANAKRDRNKRRGTFSCFHVGNVIQEPAVLNFD